MNKRALIYARASSDEQASEMTSSLDDQVLFCTQYAERNGFEVERIYQDDYTGRVRERPALMQMESDIAKNSIDAIIAWNHKRISRYWPLGLSLLTNWAEQGIEVHVVNDGGKIDFANWGILLAMFGQVEANKDIDDLRDKTMRGRNRQVENHNRIMCTGKPPYGYKIVNKGLKYKQRYEIDETEAEIVRLIFRWYTRGDENNIPLPIAEITNRLDKMGIKPPGKLKTNDKLVWRASTISRILKNELYVGIFWWGKTRMVRENPLQQESKRVKMPKDQWHRVDVPELAIIDRHIFEEAAKSLKRNRELSRRNAKYKYLLSGYLFCGDCGRRMTSRLHRAYMCMARSLKYHDCKQPHRSISVKKADGIIWDWLTWILSNEECLLEGIRSIGDQKEDELFEKRQRMERLHNSVNDLDRRISGLIEDLSYFRDRSSNRDAIDSIRRQIEDLSSAKEGLDKERSNIEAELNDQSLSDDNIEQVLNYVREVKERLPKATFEDKRYLLRLFDVKGYYISNEDKRRLDVSCAIPAFNGSFDLHLSR